MSNRPHILHVLPTLGVGGMELALARVAGALAGEMRHSVCCLRGPATIANRFGPEAEIVCLNSGRHDPSLPLRLRGLIRRLAPTAVHARNWGAWPDTAIALLTMLKRPPLIFSFHGLDDPEGMPLRRRVACRLLAKLTMRIFTVSQASRKMLLERVGLPDRVEVIPNGVNTERFSPGPPRPEGRPFVIGASGGLKPIKNQSLLVRAVAELVAAGRNVELRLAGEGPLRDELASLAHMCRIESRVRLLGHVEDMPAFLRDLDTFALTSDSEAMPNALLEAMACGLPCLCTRVGGAGEALDDGRAGMLVEPGDKDGLIQALTELMDSPSRRSELGRAARDRACRCYGLDRMMEAYRRLYVQPTEPSASC